MDLPHLVRLSVTLICFVLVSSSLRGQNTVSKFYNDFYSAVEDYTLYNDSVKLCEFYEKCTEQYSDFIKPVKFGVLRALKVTYPTNPDIACKLIKHSVERGYDTLDIKYFIQKSYPEMIFDTCVLNTINNYNVYHYKYLESINLYRINLLNEMFYRDQFVRQHLYECEDGSEIAEVDSMNILGLYTYFEEYGYPDYKTIGDDLGHYTILMHVFFRHNSIKLPNGENSYDYFYSKLYAAVKEGKMWNILFADLVDRSLTNGVDSHRPKYRVMAIDADNKAIVDEVNKSRADIYLPSLSKENLINSFIFSN